MNERKPREIKAYLVRKGVRMMDIARRMGVHHSLVQATIDGKKNNRKVLRELVAEGCPAKFLGLPEDMREAA